MKQYFKAWLITTVILSGVLFVYNGIYAVRPGMLALVQHSNGEIEVVKDVGYHWTLGTVVPMQKSMIVRTDGLGGTLYEGDTSVGEAFDLSSPNKKLYRIK